MLTRALVLAALLAGLAPKTTPPGSFLPGERVLLDAHNAYPDQGRWADRLERALATGVPLAIEQDLAWCRTSTGWFEPVVTHEKTCRGGEPTLRTHFFERIRPMMEQALDGGARGHWPLVTLNLDFKTNEPEHHAAVWALLGRYSTWLTTAMRSADPDAATHLTVGPLLVLTGDHDLQEAAFFGRVPVGGQLRLFGAARTIGGGDTGEPPRPAGRTAYRRWWNLPWREVEPGGPPEAGGWSADDAGRLRAIVEAGHADGLWVRFYTLNGHPADRSDGWHDGYNFGSTEAAAIRWRAAIAAGVDFIATDQYEAFAEVLTETRRTARRRQHDAGGRGRAEMLTP
ncbi:MAG TPA: hypothetical protein VF136_15485 [Methylomirabilota bacterium]